MTLKNKAPNMKRNSFALPQGGVEYYTEEEVQNHKQQFYKSKKFRPLLCISKYVLILAILCFAAIHLANWVLYIRGEVESKVKEYKESAIAAIAETKILKVYQPAEKIPMEELIPKVSKELGLHPVILKAIVMKESAGGDKNFLYRFEPGVFANRARTDSKYPEGERRMRASSHGITQVMGYRAEPDCGVHWSQLYDNYIALECAGNIIKENLNAAKSIKNPSQRLRTAYRMYNGSGPMAEAYATNIMSRVGELLFEKLTIESGLKEKHDNEAKAK